MWLLIHKSSITTLQPPLVAPRGWTGSRPEAEHLGKGGDGVDDRCVRGSLELRPAVRTAEHADESAGPRPMPRQEVVCGVADNGNIPHIVHLEAQGRRQHEIGIGPPTHSRTGTESEVDEPAPAQRADDR